MTIIIYRSNNTLKLIKIMQVNLQSEKLSETANHEEKLSKQNQSPQQNGSSSQSDLEKRASSNQSLGDKQDLSKTDYKKEDKVIFEQRKLQAQQIISQIKISKEKEQKKLQVQEEDDWDDDQKFQQDEKEIKEEKIYKDYYQENQNSRYIVGVDYDQVRRFTQDQNNLNNKLLPNFSEFQQFQSYEHPVEKKHLLVLYLLFRKEVYEQCQGKNRIDLHPSNKGKITIFGKSQKEITDLVKIVEQMINKISVVKLSIHHADAVKMKVSRKLTQYLNTKKLIIFKFGYPQKSYYIGGKGTQSNIMAQFQHIKKLKHKYFRLFDFKNTRSYKIILDEIFNYPIIIKNFQKKWSLKSLQIVDFIPDNGPSKQVKNKFKRQKQPNICVLMTSYFNQTLSPKQVQIDLTNFIQANFYCITLIFNKTEHYLPKINVEGVKSKIISQKKFKRSYLYIVCLKKEYQINVKQIIQAIDNMKQEIYGVRYFNNLYPNIKEYLKPDHYKIKKFPQTNPYSTTIFAKKDFKFDWKEHMMNISTIFQQKKVQQKK